MDYIQNMREAMVYMKCQPKIYCPTIFWSKAALMIADELEKKGFESFRSLETALGYFVPTYGPPGNGLTDDYRKNFVKNNVQEIAEDKKHIKSMDLFFSGHYQALADYRVLLAASDADGAIDLLKFSESAVGNPIEQFSFDGKNYSRSSLNYLLGLCFVNKHFGRESPKVVLEVGGGFGSLGEILVNACGHEIKYIDIDIPPTSTVAEYYLSKLFGEKRVATFLGTSDSEFIDINRLPIISVLCSWQIEKIVGKIDLFVNFISFQEMEPYVVENYLKHVNRLEANWILLRNLREGKQKRTKDSVGVQEPVLADDYIRMLPNYDLVDRSVHPFGYRTVDGYNSELLLFRRNADS